MIPENHILALCDFETTGIDPDKDTPIEVAILFLDHRLRILRAYESLIAYGSAIREPNLDALLIHKITPTLLENEGRLPDDVAADICNIATSFRRKRVVLCSDNIQFEWRFMSKLLGGENHEWPFHYCGWDTSLLLEVTGVGDPRNVPHRAMADVGRLHEALVRAASKASGGE